MYILNRFPSSHKIRQIVLTNLRGSQAPKVDLTTVPVSLFQFSMLGMSGISFRLFVVCEL